MKRVLYIAFALIFNSYGVKAAEDDRSIGLTFSKLVLLIQNDPTIDSIDSLVPKLPASYRDYFTLVYQSKSLQQASPKTPRIIAFGRIPNADVYDPEYGKEYPSGYRDPLTLAFQGAPEPVKGSRLNRDTLEAIDFNSQTREFEFYEMDFPRANGTGNERFKISGPNPENCKGCHRDSLRPNWEPYAGWPGVYGTIVDHTSDSSFNPLRPGDRGNGQTETANFATFLKTSRNQGRYKALAGWLGAGEKQQDRRPNLLLTLKLMGQNSTRGAQAIAKSENFPAYRFAIAGALINCDDIPGFIPDRIKPNHKLPFKFLMEDTLSRYLATLIQNGASEEKGQRETDPIVIAKLRYLLEGRGIPVDDLFTNVQPKSFFYNEVSGTFADRVGNTLLTGIPSREWSEPTNYGYSLGESSIIEKKNCAKLMQLSLESLGGVIKN